MTSSLKVKPQVARAAWLREAGWGVMFHYIDKPASSNTASATTAEEWNRQVEGFNVDRFARDIRQSGAGYVIFTLGQNTGHFCSPNATYDAITGLSSSKLSRRDLIAELAEALAPEVRLVAYLPSHAPACDPAVVEAFRLVPPWDGSMWGLPSPRDEKEVADERLSEFQLLWEAVVSEWGARWEGKVAGWWIDGCYFARRMYAGDQPPNAESFARALRSGNPDRVLAFNTGTARPFECITSQQDYTAGEVSNRFPVSNKWEPLSEMAGDRQLHILSYLGDWWGEGEKRFPDAWVTEYTRMVRSSGGAVTWDIPIGKDGSIPAPFLRQIALLGDEENNSPGGTCDRPAIP